MQRSASWAVAACMLLAGFGAGHAGRRGWGRAVREGMTWLARSPVWDCVNDRLHFADVLGEKVLSYSPATSKCQQIKQGEDVFIQSPDGLNFVEARNDPEGRLWLANAYEPDKEPMFPCNPIAKLFCIRPPAGWAAEDNLDGLVHQYGPNMVMKEKLVGFQGCRGIDFWESPAETDSATRHLLVLNGTARVLQSYLVLKENGTVIEDSQKIMLQFGSEGDQLMQPACFCIDSEGKVWVAFEGSEKLVRYDVETGAALQHVELPTKRVTGMAFGGETLEDLYVTVSHKSVMCLAAWASSRP
ncbi:hypothetical protein GUITHDRAFT_140080 [Guillardia theta CCMP2712]|uniref:SMP-30/Gluconolactonase/LRE-like region domain-containing protein n=1 Tax=Guillardia theta (strain CCMP2712) TaxID=905079 RepID=L1J785_GUITC|nr:hypothetical protein GUITHDRAFT_140080 [Guillardia theta CCMP2712]EKX43940.1 hypothetical protein GUITHDRAFT_140080 [Guillardia theta CCMP2712]|eukprot:XP_005830920.1 hypothetical protein GUITHDRAFT_140080 [Guillardia theta CCMP2712]